MAICFELPPDVEQGLRLKLGDVNRVTKEAALVELYRQEKITHHELARSLGLSRFETDALLKRHNVTEDLMTVEELQAELRPLANEDSAG